MERDGRFRVSVYSGSCILLEWLDNTPFSYRLFVGPFEPILRSPKQRFSHPPPHEKSLVKRSLVADLVGVL